MTLQTVFTQPLPAKQIVGWLVVLVPLAIALALGLATAYPEMLASLADSWGSAL